MYKIFLALLLSLGLHATTLTGAMNNPDGTGANGTLVLSLSQQAALSSSGGCGGPAQIIPTYQVRIKVVAGALQSPPSIYGNDCLLPAGTFYSMQFVDNNSNLLYTDLWLVQGSTQNIGSIVSVIISGTTQTLGGVGVVLTVPSGNQTIVQPAATNLFINYLTTTGTLTMPDGSICNATNCTFAGTVGFTNGLNTGTTNPSILWTGPGGNLYTRPTGGLSTAVSCSGIKDGWLAVTTDNYAVVCIGGARFRALLQAY
jgi:hypothetical protein